MAVISDEVKESFKDAIQLRSAINVMLKYEQMAIAYGWEKLHDDNPDVDFSKLYYDVKTGELKEKSLEVKEVPDVAESVTEVC